MQSYIALGHLQVTNVSRPKVEDWWAGVLSTCMKACLITALMLISKFLSTWLRFTFDSRRMQRCKIPATIPYLFPILRSSVNFVWNPLQFIRTATYVSAPLGSNSGHHTKFSRFYDGKQGPVRIKVLGSEIFLIQGQENIVSLFKQTTASTATYVHMFFLKNLFGMNLIPLSAYKADDSGHRSEPYPNSMIEPHNRINFLTHDSLVRFLSGPSLILLFERFNRSLSDRLAAVEIGADWIQIPDFLEFIQMELSTAVLEATTGPQLVARNPTFVSDLFKYDSVIPTLSKRLPRCMAPKAYTIRDKMLCMIKNWHAYAREHFDEQLVDPNGDYDPFWGSEHIRYRQKILLNVDGFDEDAMASSDLGLIWA